MILLSFWAAAAWHLLSKPPSVGLTPQIEPLRKRRRVHRGVVDWDWCLHQTRAVLIFNGVSNGSTSVCVCCCFPASHKHRATGTSMAAVLRTAADKSVIRREVLRIGLRLKLNFYRLLDRLDVTGMVLPAVARRMFHTQLRGSPCGQSQHSMFTAEHTHTHTPTQWCTN